MKKEREGNEYFFNLESHNKIKSSGRKIFNGEGTLITDPQKVRQEIERFYSDLCKSDTLSPPKDKLNLTPLDLFRLVSVVNALPSEW